MNDDFVRTASCCTTYFNHLNSRYSRYFYLSIYLSVYLSIYLSIHCPPFISISLSICHISITFAHMLPAPAKRTLSSENFIRALNLKWFNLEHKPISNAVEAEWLFCWYCVCPESYKYILVNQRYLSIYLSIYRSIYLSMNKMHTC